MRLFLAGAVAVLFCVVPALAQPTGEVESIGFNGVYRPGCWTQMIVRIRPNGAASGTYQIQVKQRDLDNDVAVFARKIALTGSGESRDQRYSMLFIPQPVNGGLPNNRNGGQLRDVQKVLEVYLCTETGKQITQLPVTTVPDDIDPPSGFDSKRGCRMIAVVNDGGSAVAWSEYNEGLQSMKGLIGVLEDVLFVPMKSRDLPENPLAYEAIDAIVWLDADPGTLRGDGGQREQALQAYVRQGGHLVISQNATNWQQTLEFGDMLPVDIEGIVTRDNPEPLATLAEGMRSGARADRTRAQWDRLEGPFSVAKARPRQGTLVDAWTQLPGEDPKNPRPFIARKLYGCGAVSWVGQNLGDPAMTRIVKSGWVNIWNAVLDFRDDPIPVIETTNAAGSTSSTATQIERETYAPAVAVDMGVAINVGLESKARVGLFITLAVVFFLFYWLIAGPGVYLFLATRKQTQLSWFSYAAVALLATLLTVLVVRLVLRGPPELRHLTLVRGSPDGPDALVRSRFGLYIPRDGMQRLALAQPASVGNVSAIAALPIHPVHLRGEIDTAGKLNYTVPVREPSSPGPAELDVPYRSTLKQYESRWVGPVDGKIEGLVRIDSAAQRYLDGKLTNATGADLKNIYFVYKVQLNRSEDWMLYLPEWKSGTSIDLQQLMRDKDGKAISVVDPTKRDIPGVGRPIIGIVALDWMPFWTIDFRGLTTLGEGFWDDSPGRTPRAVPMLSIFNRLPPARADLNGARVEVLRRGARAMDLSPAVAAGGVVVVAEAVDVPQPVGLSVDGDAAPGTGRTIYQFVLPAVRPPPQSPDVEQPN